MRVLYTETALGEIDLIVSYIAKDNQVAAGEVAAAIEWTVEWIVAHPEFAPAMYEGEVRAKMVGRYQYRIFYQVKGDVLIIRNVRRTKQLRPWEST